MFEGIQKYGEKFINKFNDPFFVFLNIAFLWIALLYMSYTTDANIMRAQEYINENVKYAPQFYNANLSSVTPDNITIHEVPR
jgi:hypothetical protein